MGRGSDGYGLANNRLHIVTGEGPGVLTAAKF
jgi:hypothetical protein